MVTAIVTISSHQMSSVPLTKLDEDVHVKYPSQIGDMTRVDDAVAEILQAAKDEAAPAAELSEDSKTEEEEAEVATAPASETDVHEAEEDDGIHIFFSYIGTFINHIQDH